MSQVSFLSTGISEPLAAALSTNGFTTPTPVQLQAIPAALTGADVIAVAKTGTGKTLAFGLPLIEQLRNNNESALVLVPTRELALQVEASLRAVLTHTRTNLRTVVLIGGTSIHNQLAHLKRNPRIVIATPGRLRDHIDRKSVHLSSFRRVVLDEADRMLDMGFLPEIRRILAGLPADRQTMLFSATFPPELTQLVAGFLKEAIRVEVAPSGSTADAVQHEICYLAAEKKPTMLRKFLGDHQGPVLVFARTRHGARRLKRTLERDGFGAAELHSDRTLAQRRTALDGFKSGKYRVLVATDVAARGIDVEAIELVVNYDLPDAAEDYVHRIGRTGRAGKSGRAVSFATHEQYHLVRDIERFVRSEISLTEDSEKPAVRTAPSAPSRPRGNQRRRFRGPRQRQQGR